jgi:hypothetical protein
LAPDQSDTKGEKTPGTDTATKELQHQHEQASKEEIHQDALNLVAELHGYDISEPPEICICDKPGGVNNKRIPQNQHSEAVQIAYQGVKGRK